MNKITSLMLRNGIAALFSFSVFSLQAQQTADVQVESTIRGNQEQPKTIYVLPWQAPVSVIRIPGQPLLQEPTTVSPLDRQQFLRFIAVQQGVSVPQTSQTVNPQKQ